MGSITVPATPVAESQVPSSASPEAVPFLSSDGQYVFVVRAMTGGRWRASVECVMPQDKRHTAEVAGVYAETMTNRWDLGPGSRAVVPFGLGPVDALAALLDQLRAHHR